MTMYYTPNSSGNVGSANSPTSYSPWAAMQNGSQFNQGQYMNQMNGMAQQQNGVNPVTQSFGKGVTPASGGSSDGKSSGGSQPSPSQPQQAQSNYSTMPQQASSTNSKQYPNFGKSSSSQAAAAPQASNSVAPTFNNAPATGAPLNTLAPSSPQQTNDLLSVLSPDTKATISDAVQTQTGVAPPVLQNTAPAIQPPPAPVQAPAPTPEAPYLDPTDLLKKAGPTKTDYGIPTPNTQPRYLQNDSNFGDQTKGTDWQEMMKWAISHPGQTARYTDSSSYSPNSTMTWDGHEMTYGNTNGRTKFQPQDSFWTQLGLAKP